MKYTKFSEVNVRRTTIIVFSRQFSQRYDLDKKLYDLGMKLIPKIKSKFMVLDTIGFTSINMRERHVGNI